MSEKSLYPAYTNERKNKRNKLAPKQAEAWENFSKTVFQAGALDEKDQAADCGCRCTRNAMPLLHQRSCSSGIEKRGNTGRDHGSHLGGS